MNLTTMLVGYTGFVGSNLAVAHEFDYLINSKNIEEAYGVKPDLLVYAGVRAEKFLANTAPEADMENIREALENIRKIKPKELVLISTVDVYKKPVEVDEDSFMELEGLHPYGANRLWLEEQVRKEFPKAAIIRLPGLFGKNLKKNFLYDYIQIIPALLKEEKYLELAENSLRIAESYEKQPNGFYKCVVSEENKEALKRDFEESGFTALKFTDSRGVFQFYHLAHLWNHIEKVMELGIHKLNIATEPVSVAEIYKMLRGREFDNKVAAVPPYYDYRTKYSREFGGENGYLYTKQQVLEEIKGFIEANRS